MLMTNPQHCTQLLLSLVLSISRLLCVAQVTEYAKFQRWLQTYLDFLANLSRGPAAKKRSRTTYAKSTSNGSHRDTPLINIASGYHNKPGPSI